MSHTVSRREFLKIAGIAGASIAMGAGLGGLVSACSGEDALTTTSAAIPISTSATLDPSTTTSASTTTTTVSSGPEGGEEVKIGFVTPITGQLASFGVSDAYCLGRWKDHLRDGLVCGDGKRHAVAFEVQDSRSDVTHATRVTRELIDAARVDLMMVASTADTVVPVVEGCEAGGVPCVSTDCPWQIYVGPRTDYKWSYHVFFGGEDWMRENWAIFEQMGSNKQVGAMFDSTSEGEFFGTEVPFFLERKGYTVIDRGRFRPGTEDFTPHITAFRNNAVELITGNMIAPDFMNFWKQAVKAGLRIKACMVGTGAVFPSTVEALGDIAHGLLKDLSWHRSFPWTSSLTGETCAQLGDDFEASTGQRQAAPLAHYLLGEMAIYALTESDDPKNREALLAAIETMKLDSIAGPVDFTKPVVTAIGPGGADWPAGPGRKTKNVYDPGLAAAQWLARGGKQTFDEVPVDKTCAPYLPDGSLSKPEPLPIAQQPAEAGG